MNIIDMRNIFYAFVLLILSIGISSCVDHTFDEPPGFQPEQVDANGSVGDLLDRWVSEQFVEITDDLIISGRVAANDDTGNFYKQLVIQDETGGIQVRLDAIGLFNEYPIGRLVKIKCQGLYISDFNGLPQLSSAQGSGSDISSIAIPEPLIPDVLFNTTDTETVEPVGIDINDASTNLLNTFIKIDDVQFTVGSAAKPLADAANQFSINHDIEDCNENTMIVRTSGFAAFASEFTPSEKGSIEGILSVFGGDYQLLLRGFDGIQMQDSRCDGSGNNNNNNNTGDPVDSVDEDFETLSDNQDVAIDEWSNIAVKGTRLWRAKEFDGNVYVQATAFNDTSDEMEAWLITPKVKFDSAMKMELRSAVAFHVHDGLSVWYSNDFDGTDVANATWNELTLTLAGGSQDNYDWVQSGEIDLSDISGDAYIGFKYVGNPSNGTTSFILDDVQIVEK